MERDLIRYSQHKSSNAQTWLVIGYASVGFSTWVTGDTLQCSLLCLSLLASFVRKPSEAWMVEW